MAKLLSKEEVKAFGSIKELRDFNNLQEMAYSWVEFDTVDGEYVPLEDNPICIPIIRDDLQISDDVTDETISDQMADTKLALKYPIGDELKCYPVGPTAYRGVLERVGGTCPALTSLKETRARTEVSPTDKAAICNMLTKYTKGKSLLLVGDELVLADLSSDYVRLPFSDILDITENELGEKFEYVRYVRGTVSHESSSAEFIFQDDEIDSNLLDAFNKIGIDTSDYNAHIKVLTSDVGLSGANIYPFIRSEKTGNQISIGTPIKLEHIGNADMDKFKANLLSCFSSFVECSEHLDAMSNTKIHNPADTLYNIGHKVGLPEKLIKEAYEDFDNEFSFTCKGTDVYVKLFDILDSYISDEEVSDIRQMQLNENITRICFYSLSKYDMPAI